MEPRTGFGVIITRTKKKVLIYSLEPEREVFHKSKEWLNTGLYHGTIAGSPKSTTADIRLS
jgi:hypothetical protein